MDVVLFWENQFKYAIYSVYLFMTLLFLSGFSFILKNFFVSECFACTIGIYIMYM